MNKETTLLRCDRLHLGVTLAIQFGILAIVAVLDLALLGMYAIAGMCVVFASAAAVHSAICRTYRFTLGKDNIRTEKLFTQHIDLRTPIEKIVSVSVYEGVIEALVGVGTIEISTASSDHKHATIKWPHIRDHRKVAISLRQLRSPPRHG